MNGFWRADTDIRIDSEERLQQQPSRGLLTRRLQAAFQVSEDSGRLDHVLVNLLIAGFLTLAVVGIVEAMLVDDPTAWVQPVATVVLTVWAWLGKRRGRPQPVPLLLVSATLSAGYLVATAALEVPATTSSPIVMLVGSGALALIAGARRAVGVGAYVTLLAAVSVTSVQVTLDTRPAALAADVLSSVIVMLLVYYLVRSVWVAYDRGASLYTGLIETAPVAVLEVDLSTLLRPGDGIDRPFIRDINSRARRLLGIMGADVRAIAHDDVGEQFAEQLTAIVASKAYTGETVVDIEGRSMIVSWKALNRTFNRVIFSAVDITAQRQAEQSLAEQVRARDQFIATVSHELRTPLTGILGLLEVLKTGEVAYDEAAELLELALGQTHDMADIVQDLLVAARASSGGLVINPETTDLHEVTASVLSTFAHDIAIEVEAHSPVLADPVRIRQIIRNLLTNALRYGGTERRVVVGGPQRDTTIEVRDNGPGLPDDFRDRMFEAYQRSPLSDLPTESVGLGLTVARTLARLMDGDLTYHHDGAESVFRLTLPQAAATTAAGGSAQASMP